MTDAKEKTEWQGLQPDLYNIPQGFDKAAALSASKREFESGAQSSGDKVEHKILDFVDTDYILADSDEAALDTLYEAENNRYRARVAELYGTFQKAESELNSDIAKKSAQEQEQRATLDAMTWMRFCPPIPNRCKKTCAPLWKRAENCPNPRR